MKIYIAGKITGDPNYRQKFKDVADDLERGGHAVMNPAVLPDGFGYADYIAICVAMINACDMVYLLDDWVDSSGAKFEKHYAEVTGKKINMPSKYTDSAY